LISLIQENRPTVVSH